MRTNLEGYLFEQAVEKRGNINTGQTYWVTSEEDALELTGVTDEMIRDALYSKEET